MKKEIKQFFEQDNVKARFAEMLGKRAPQFITSVLQVAASNADLSESDPVSIYNAAAVAATLDLPINNNLGFAYIIAYNSKQPDGTWKKVAQFQMGYKGFIQLSQRSGRFKTMSAAPIFEGQLVESNPLLGYKFDFTPSAKKSDKIIGFASYFQLINGFEKVYYMTTDELKAHGLKYSKTYSKESSKWKTDFEAMALKTVLKLLLSKFAPLSIEMEKAIVVDQAVINNDQGTEVEYVDVNTAIEVEPVDKTVERVQLLISDCKTMPDLVKLEEYCTTPELVELFNGKSKELIKGGAKK